MSTILPDHAEAWSVCPNPSCPRRGRTSTGLDAPLLPRSVRSCPACLYRLVPLVAEGEQVATWRPPSWAADSTPDHHRVMHTRLLGQVAALDATDQPLDLLSVTLGQDDELRTVGRLSVQRGPVDIALGEVRFAPGDARLAAELLVAAADLADAEVSR